MNPVVERMSGSLHLQLLSGCPPAIYWAGSYIWDMGTHLLVCFASLVIFAAFDDKVCPHILLLCKSKGGDPLSAIKEGLQYRTFCDHMDSASCLILEGTHTCRLQPLRLSQ